MMADKADLFGRINRLTDAETPEQRKKRLARERARRYRRRHAFAHPVAESPTGHGSRTEDAA